MPALLVPPGLQSPAALRGLRPLPRQPAATAVPGTGFGVRSVSTYASGGTEASPATPDLPPGWQPGDVIYIGWELTATSGTVTTPAGWTSVFTPIHAASSTTNTLHGVLRRVMQAGDAAPAITFTSGRMAMALAAVQGADNTTPEDVTPVADDNTGVTAPSVRAPSVTPVTAGCLLLTFHAVRNGTNGGATAFTPDATEAEQADVAAAAAGVSGAAVEAASLLLGAASATGTKTATATGLVGTINMMGSAIAVRPAATAATVSGAATLPAESALTAPAVQSATASLPAEGTLSAPAAAQATAARQAAPAALAAAATLAAPAAVQQAAAPLTAAATLTAPAAAAIAGAALAAAATLTGTGTAAGGTIQGAAALAAAATLTAKGTQRAGAGLAAAGTLTALALQRAAASLAAEGTLAASALAITPVTYGTARQGAMAIPAAAAGQSGLPRAQSGT